MRASFLSMQPYVSLACRVRLLPIIITTAGVSVSAETHKPIYHIYRYCNAASIHSPMCSISLTLLHGMCEMRLAWKLFILLILFGALLIIYYV